jgi:Arc/MetJ-type ribon-helix-helix transcriptional regulator
MKTKSRVEYYLHDDDFLKLKDIVEEGEWKSVSELVRHIIHNGEDPEKLPRKKRNLTIDAEGIEKIKGIAEKQFSGNPSEALNYLINDFLKDQS